MKESDARQKWCPHKRVIFNNNGRFMLITGNCMAVSNDDKEDVINFCDKMEEVKTFKCIASDCMMWVEYQVTTSNMNDEIERSWTEGRCGLIKENMNEI